MIKAAAKFIIDTKKVNDAADAAAMRNIIRQGYRIMTISKASIEQDRKGDPSKPGQPPKSRTGVLKKRIKYAAVPSQRMVVIGAEKVAGKFGQAAGVLEHGGMADLAETVPVVIKGKRRFKKTGRRVKVKIAARPYMGPALKQSQSELNSIWKNSIGAK